MRALIIEDDFTSRTLLQKLMAPFGDIDIAVNGKEAVDAFRAALAQGSRYNVILLDIMMPEMDGQEALKQIRALEADNGILGLDGVKVIMTTALGDHENVMEAFRQQCDAYLVKPVDREKLHNHLKSFGVEPVASGE